MVAAASKEERTIRWTAIFIGILLISTQLVVDYADGGGLLFGTFDGILALFQYHLQSIPFDAHQPTVPQAGSLPRISPK